MMKHEELHEVDVSRRKFLKFGGLLGLALGALSLPSLSRGEPTADPRHETGQEPWLEAHKKKSKKSKRTSGKKKSANEGSSADWQEIA
jgi:hypothetical protein